MESKHLTEVCDHRRMLEFNRGLPQTWGSLSIGIYCGSECPGLITEHTAGLGQGLHGKVGDERERVPVTTTGTGFSTLQQCILNILQTWDVCSDLALEMFSALHCIFSWCITGIVLKRILVVQSYYSRSQKPMNFQSVEPHGYIAAVAQWVLSQIQFHPWGRGSATNSLEVL